MWRGKFWVRDIYGVRYKVRSNCHPRHKQSGRPVSRMTESFETIMWNYILSTGISGIGENSTEGVPVLLFFSPRFARLFWRIFEAGPHWQWGLIELGYHANHSHVRTFCTISATFRQCDNRWFPHTWAGVHVCRDRGNVHGYRDRFRRILSSHRHGQQVWVWKLECVSMTFDKTDV